MDKTQSELNFFKDHSILLIISVNALIVLATVVSVVARLRSNDFKVPVQYVVNDGSVLQVSHWFSLYSIAIFTVFSAVVVTILAQRLYHGEQNYSRAVLVAYAVTAVFGLFATNALLNLVSKV